MKSFPHGSGLGKALVTGVSGFYLPSMPVWYGRYFNHWINERSKVECRVPKPVAFEEYPAAKGARRRLWHQSISLFRAAHSHNHQLNPSDEPEPFSLPAARVIPCNRMETPKR